MLLHGATKSSAVNNYTLLRSPVCLRFSEMCFGRTGEGARRPEFDDLEGMVPNTTTIQQPHKLIGLK